MRGCTVIRFSALFSSIILQNGNFFVFLQRYNMTFRIMKSSLTIQQLSNYALGRVPKGTSIWLYGSRARGTERDDSDWDVLILLDKKKIEQEDFDKISYPLIEFGWHFGADLSPQLYTRAEWKQMHNTPYCQNVEREKKIIYESN